MTPDDLERRVERRTRWRARREALRASIRGVLHHLARRHREAQALAGVACALVALGALLDWRWSLLALGLLLVADSGVVRLPGPPRRKDRR